MNVVREIQRLNEKELQRGTQDGSWHDQYKDSAWIYVGGLPYELSEGDVICVFSQWGEVEDMHLVRDKGTGKSKGFAFLKYEDQRSTVLAVDNFNGVKLLDRVLRVDHKEKYRLPKELLDKEEQKIKEAMEKGMAVPGGPLWKPGHAYEGKELVGDHSIEKGVDLFARPEEKKGRTSHDELEEEMSAGDGEGDDATSLERKRRKEDKKRRKKDEKKAKKEAKKNGRKRERPRSDSDASLELHPGSNKAQRESGAEGRWDRSEGLQAAEEAPAAPAGPGQSWRGRYDPAAKQDGGRGGGGTSEMRPAPQTGRGSMWGRAFNNNRRGRGDMAGIGGLNRRR